MTMTSKSQKTQKKTMQGVVVSDAMDKTIVVRVETFKTDKKYNKKYKSSKKYKVHDENNQYKVGEVVDIVEVSPISKDKSFSTIDK